MLLSVLGFGFLIGMRHALDSDHVAAVSTIISRNEGTTKAAAISMIWGIGHTITLAVAAFIMLLTKVSLTEHHSLWLEGMVGIVLIYLGVRAFLPRPHREHHSKRALSIGMIHGLAGSAGLALLSITALDSVSQGVLYTLVFGVGSIIGMMLIGTLLGSVLTTLKKWQFYTIRITGLVSIAVGVLMARPLLW